jgi:DNA-directed RNA polymerase specialized sigma24 family protein
MQSEKIHERGWTPLEALAVCRLRQWRADRTILRGGGVAASRNQAAAHRTGPTGVNHPSRFDARIVRCVSFEKALATLPVEHQQILMLVYAERQSQTEASNATGRSIRSIQMHLDTARAELTAALDKLDLL